MECSYRRQPMLPGLEHEARRKAGLQTGQNGTVAYYNIRYANFRLHAGRLRMFSTTVFELRKL